MDLDKSTCESDSKSHYSLTSLSAAGLDLLLHRPVCLVFSAHSHRPYQTALSTDMDRYGAAAGPQIWRGTDLQKQEENKNTRKTGAPLNLTTEVSSESRRTPLDLDRVKNSSNEHHQHVSHSLTALAVNLHLYTHKDAAAPLVYSEFMNKLARKTAVHQ